MRVLITLLALVLTAACEGDMTVIYPNAPSATTTTTVPPTAVPLPSRIEFRVTGNAVSARVRYSHIIDGLTQVITTLPYVTAFTTTETTLFLSLEATPTAYHSGILFPAMAAQIFVDGVLFREATSNELRLSPVAVSGTWRK